MFNGKTPQERIDAILEAFGVKVINLVIERHNLSTEKRMLFSVRFVEEDSEKEREYTEEMDKLTEKISMIDDELHRKGIEKNWRLQILRDIKKLYPDDWHNGFAEEN